MRNNYPSSKLIGSKIIYYRKMKGVSLSQLAKVIGVSEQQQSRYERGINRINLDRLAQYVKYFEVDFKDFFSVTNEEHLSTKNHLTTKS
nr:helix-turn-helix transcriptional regulator [uncultured Moellerella sp.]